MGKPLKIFFSTLLLLVAIVFILPWAINPNNFKPEIVTFIKDHTGRDLILEGDLKISIFPWLGISTGKIIVSNVPGFQEQAFASIEESQVNVLLLPLLSNKVDIHHIVLKGLVLNLVKNRQGVGNWEHLKKPETPAVATLSSPVTTQPFNSSALAISAIGGIAVENAQINWNDLNTQQLIEIKDLNINTDKVTYHEPIGIVVSFNAVDVKAKTSHHLKLNTELTVTQALDIFTLRHSDLQSIATGEPIPENSLSSTVAISDIALDIAKQTAKIQGLQLKAGDMTVTAELTGTTIKDNPTFFGPVVMASFSPIQLIQQLGIKLPVMQDAHSLTKLAMSFDLSATHDFVELQKLVISLDDSQIKGVVSIKDLAQPAFNFALDIDALDIDRYLASANKSSKLLATPAVLLASGITIIPVERLRALNSEGKMSLGKLKVNGQTLQDVQLNLNINNGLVTAHQSIKQFYQGSYTGDLSLDTHGDKSLLTLNEHINHLQLEPLLKDIRGTAQMSGLVNLSAHLQGQGRKIDELKATLNGKLNFLIKDSVIKGFNLQKLIAYRDIGKGRESGAALPGDPKNDQTLFSEMTGSATLTNGLLQNNDLVAISSKLRVDGKGNLNLNSDVLDYKIDAKLLNDAISATKPEAVEGAVGLNITGTLTQPLYTVDLTSLLTEQHKVKIEKLIDKIDKKIGPGLGDLLKGFLKKI